MIHCTGGAQTKVMKFVNNLHVIKDNLFELPPLFRIIREQSETSWEEMYEVFNMGHRFEIYGSRELAEKVIKIAADMGVEAKIIGRCETAEKNKLTIKSEFGEFVY
jgi:phosphoribosylformylglycinamidine cyclo-ligase